MYNMEATSSFIQKVLPRLKFLKSRSNIQVKVTKKLEPQGALIAHLSTKITSVIS